MWIRPEIQDDFSPEDIIAEAMGDYVLEFLLAVEFDDRRRATQAHLMSVMLIDGGSFVGDLDGIYDLRFGIREKQVGNEFIVGEPDFSHARSRRCICRDDRGRVFKLVCGAVRMLVEHVEPAGVTMTTYDRYLPRKAITKYQRICRMLEGLGYACRRAYIDPDGRNRWFYMRWLADIGKSD